MHQIKKTGFKL